jgi:hypothetical protein
MKPITVRAAVRRVASIRNLNLQMIPCKNKNMLAKDYVFYIPWKTIPISMRLTQLPCKGMCGKYALM